MRPPPLPLLLLLPDVEAPPPTLLPPSPTPTHPSPPPTPCSYASTALPLLLPAVEAGVLNANWRIRQSSIELLGDLLFKVGGWGWEGSLGPMGGSSPPSSCWDACS